ncbi:MAG: type VI secretion system protein TssL [Chitinophagaceae bacterium]|nr:type VI secretion system protein TssL [Rubrivivax sp.]
MSEPGDPFAAFGSDRTIIKPSAGRSGVNSTSTGPADPPAPQAPAGREVPLALDMMMSGSLNPLVNAAMPLLAAAPRVRHTARHPNPAGLRDALAEGIRKFEAQARAQGLPNEQVVAGRYILCTLLDESAASTPWGSSGGWSGNSLLVQFHNENWGGEKVFQLLSKLAENVDANRSLLELLYAVLGLGFQGRYRVIDNGEAQLDSVRGRLAKMLLQGRTSERALSPRWQGVKARPQRLVDGVPLWLIGSVLLMLLAIVYAGLRWSLADSADVVFNKLAALDAKKVQLAAPPPPPAPAPAPRLAGLLTPQIQAGLVDVQDRVDRSIVTVKGDGFFEPGGAVIAAHVQPLMTAIGQALATLDGNVLITGHTDDRPIRTLRFPSNWHLSQERAAVVRSELGRQVAPERMRAEGLADTQPITDNTTPAGRSRNRRVEITLLATNPGVVRE